MTDTTERQLLQNAELDDSPELRELYRQFAEHHLSPLWTQTSNVLTGGMR